MGKVLPDGFVWIKGAGLYGRYAVNKAGDIWSSLWNSRIMKTRCGGLYPSFSYFNGSIKLKKSVHRAVAEAFIPNPKGLPEVNHIDGNIENNKIENLEWCTRSWNQKHAFRNGLQKVTKKHLESVRANWKKIGLSNRRFSLDDAKEMRRLHKDCGLSQRSIAKMYGVCQSAISRIVSGERYKNK